MKRRAAALLIMGLLSILALGPWQSASADDSAFTIDKLEMDVVQMSNDTAFMVIERVYFNNTGDSAYNGTLHHWLLADSEVFSMVCLNASTTVMRRVNVTGYRCYNYTRDTIDGNIIEFTPFDENESLSYYGQEANLILNASNANGSSWHSVPINITVGWGNQSRPSQSSGQGLSISSSLERMEAKQPVVSHTNITTSQWLNITNTSPGNETVSLSVQGLPQGWKARFFDGTSENVTFDLLPSETKAVRFEVELPPHKVSMEFFYFQILDVSGDKQKTVTFEQSFFHNVSRYSLWFFSRTGSTVDLSTDYSHFIFAPGEYTFPDWLHSIYFFDDQWSPSRADLHDIFGFPTAGETLQITIEWEETTEEESQFGALIIALLIVIIAIVFVIVLRSANGREEDAETEKEAAGEDQLGEDRGVRISESLKEAEAAFAEGHLSEEFYENLKRKYEGEMAEIEEVPMEDPEIVALKEEKEKLLRAIKALQQRLDDGKISESGYDQLVKDYKERAIEIMKDIDKKSR
jgi:uncharacterized membrane protein